MKFCFDKNMTKVKDDKGEEDLYYYSSYLHSALKVDSLAAAVFDYIIEHPEKDISCQEVADAIPELNAGDVEEIFEELCNTGLFFDNIASFHAKCFESCFQAGLHFEPRQVYLHLTYRCNLACEYCYNKEKLNSGTELEIDEWKKVIDDLKSVSSPRIYLTGGEPTLYKDFESIVDYVYNAGLKIELLTNGTTLHLISKDTLEKLDTATISLDNIGDSKTHRRNSEKYKILDNILMLNSIGKKVNVRSVLSVDTYEEVNEVRQYMLEHNINHITALFVPNSIDEINKFPLNADADSFKSNTNLQDIRKCGACFQVLAIDPSGIVYPCQSLMKSEFALESIKNADWIKGVENNDLTKYFLYRTVERIDKCRDCEVKSICGGGCPAISYKLYNSLEHRLDYACDFLKAESIFHIKHVEFE